MSEDDIKIEELTSYEVKEDYKLKVIVIGDSEVGKTNLIKCFISKSFDEKYKSTIGVEFISKSYKINGKIFKIEIWDTSGQERHKSITSAYYKGAKGSLLVYDTTKRTSFENIDKWIAEIKAKTSQDIKLMILGNKIDLEEQKQVTIEKALRKAKDLGYPLKEVSAKNRNNVKEAFYDLFREMYKEIMKKIDSVESKESNNEKNEIQLEANEESNISDAKEKKCSSKAHNGKQAISFCHDCRIYLCNKCQKTHTELYDHLLISQDKDLKEIFTGYCEEENHPCELNFYCKTHNKLICAACISKIKIEGFGQHTDCDISTLEDIKDAKKELLQENIKFLEELSNTLRKSLNNEQKFFEKMKDNKEELKIKIQKIFTKLRNCLNEREEIILKEVDKKYDNLYFEDGLKKENQINICLEKCKIINNNYGINKLNKFINDCISIENNLKKFQNIKEKVKIFNSINFDVNFYPQEEELNNFIEKITKFGYIFFNRYKFKKPLKNENYNLKEKYENIITKTGEDQKWTLVLSENILENEEQFIWKIKILKTKNYHIMAGVTHLLTENENKTNIIKKINFLGCEQKHNDNPFVFFTNQNKNNFIEEYKKNNQYGWFFNCFNSTLYSDLPENSRGKKTNLPKVKEELMIIMNIKKRTLKIIIDNDNLNDEIEEIYKDIQINKPLVPAVLLYDNEDSVLINGY